MSAGRPKKPGARYPSGRRRPDGASPELIAKRAALVGGYRDPRDARRQVSATDPLAGCPIGILYLRGALMHADYAAAAKFAGLYVAVWGRGRIKSALDQEVGRLLGADDDGRERRRIRLADSLGEATAQLLALPTRRPYHVLVNLAVYERPMRFMDDARSRTPAAWQADQRDLDALREATACLAAWWRIGRKDAA